MNERAPAPLPIYDASIERAILGAGFEEPDETLTHVAQTRAEHFFDEKHRLIRAAFDRVQAAGLPVDMLLVSAELKACAELNAARSEEHTSELQSRPHLVCRL